LLSTVSSPRRPFLLPPTRLPRGSRHQLTRVMLELRRFTQC